MTTSSEVLNYLEQHLDAAHIAKVMERLRRAMNFEPGAEMALHILYPHPNIKSGSLPMIRANYGFGLLVISFAELQRRNFVNLLENLKKM